MLRTLGNVASNVASTVAGGVGRLVDVRPAYRQIGNYVVKGASYESFDSSGLFGSWGSNSSTGGSSDSSGLFSGWGSSSSSSTDSSGYFSGIGSSFGVSSDSSGMLGGLGQIGNSWGGASGGTDASDGSGASSYLPSGQSTGIFFGISAVLALFPVALILNHMITMPLIMRICVAIVVYGVCLVNPFMSIPIYLFYIMRAALRYNAGEKYLLFPFFGFLPLRVRKVTDGSFITALTWIFSYLDPDLSKERHVKQRKEYVANAELYVASLVNTLRLSKEEIGKLGINKLAQTALDKILEPLTGPVQKGGEPPSATAEAFASAVPAASAVANTESQKGESKQANQTSPSASPATATAVPVASAVANTELQKGESKQANRNASVNSATAEVTPFAVQRNGSQANRNASATPLTVTASAVQKNQISSVAPSSNANSTQPSQNKS